MKLRYFRPEEFKCPCCGKLDMDNDFMIALDKIRASAGIPFVITSGFRCDAHNRAVGGTITSSHTKGLAADIKCSDSYSRWAIFAAAYKMGIHRIGIGGTFLHLDMDEEKVGGVIWLYL